MPEAVQGTAIHGVAMGGRSPVTGSSIYLYAASTSGYGTAATSLLRTTAAGVLTDTSGNGYVLAGAGGSFGITGDYTCPSASTPVYLLGAGGNPGLTGSVNNTAIMEMAALGPCGSLSSSTFIVLDELSTVAAVSALGPFLSASGSVATSSTNVTGLTHAFTTATNLKALQNNYPNAKTPSGLGSVPYQEINTLADVLAACVQSSGPSSTTCNTLFTATTPSGGSAPTNILQAMLNINRHPAQNVATLYGLVSPTSPYLPTLPATYNSFTNRYDGQPNDWTVAITYTAPNHLFDSINYLAIDSQSNIWTAASSGHVAQLSNAGALNLQLTDPSHFVGTNNYNQVLAVDLNDNLWIDDNSYAITKVTAAGAFSCAGTYYCDVPGLGTNYADGYSVGLYVRGYGGIAIDPSTNNVWVGSASNYQSSLVKTDNNGVGLANYQVGGIINPIAVAVDQSGNIWLANYGSPCCNPNTVTKVSPSGTVLSGTSGFTGGGLATPSAIAFDHAGNAWIADYTSTSGLTELTSSGTPLTSSAITGGGINAPSDIAFDGDGNLWISNWMTAGISEFSGTGTALSPSLGFYDGNGSVENGSVAIDSSGNVWASNWNVGTVQELVGVAAPTVNPLVLATKNNTIGTRP